MKKILKNSGISPAVGVILLIGITAAVATLSGVVLLDIGDGLTQTAQAGVEVNETTNGVEVTWNTDSNAEQIIVQANGQEYQLNGVNDSLTLGLTEGSNVSIIGVVDGEKSVISETTTESDTGEGTVKNYSPGETSTVSGKVSVNPDIENATVKSVKNDTVISTTTTDSSGSYSLEAPENSRLEVIVEDFTYDSGSKTFYGSTVQDLGSELDSDVDIAFTEPESKVNVNGSQVLVANESYNGMKTIGSVEQLQAMKDDLSSDYMLLSDIDASDTQNWNDNGSGTKLGFEPIGSLSNKFTGVLDGNGHKVTGLTINRSSTNHIGLVGYANSESEIKNIGVKNIDITGDGDVGGLAGEVEGEVSDSYAEGSVAGDDDVGGLVGAAVSSVSGSYATGSVEGVNDVGGLAGVAESSVSDSYAEGSVTSSGDDVGGLVGAAEDTVSGSYATGDVKEGVNDVGGLVGEAEGTVSDSYAEGSVTSSGDDVGGLIGSSEADVSESYSTSNVTGENDVGGLTGYQQSDIQNSYAKGSVTGIEDVGGLTGHTTTDIVIEKSYAAGSITGDSNAAGLIGRNSDSDSSSDAIVKDLYWDTETTEKSEAIATTGSDSVNNGDIVGLTTSEMTGSNAESNMTVFNFTSVWETTNSSYPILQNNTE